MSYLLTGVINAIKTQEFLTGVMLTICVVIIVAIIKHFTKKYINNKQHSLSPTDGHTSYTKLTDKLIVMFMILFTVGIISLLGFSMYSYEITKFEITKEIDVESSAISAIMTATDNAINKIYNILVVTTIFITVIVATFTIFQYLKMKNLKELEESIEKMKDMLISEMNELVKSEVYKLKNETTELSESKAIQVKDEVNKHINILIEKTVNELNISSIKSEIEILIMQTQTAYTKNHYDRFNIGLTNYKKILELIHRYPDAIDNEKLGLVYHEYAIALATISPSKAEEYGLKSIETYHNRYENAVTYKFLADLMMQNGLQISQAIRYLEQSIECNESLFDSSFMLIKCLDMRNRNNDLERALSLIEKLLEKNTNITMQYLNQVELINLSKKYPDKISEIKLKFTTIQQNMLSNSQKA